MRYGSVCSGIEAATVAWHPLGWTPIFFSEIEAFPNAVLKHHWPAVPNYGDMTKFKEWPCEQGSIELLVGGTPCQSFSVAGLRKGMDDPRGNLALTFLAIADRLRPEWVVWENVPGVLSLDKGRAFGSIVGGLGQLGYGWAYRVLDAQYFGVPQRRRRPFVVGHLGDWRRAAAVLLERESLSGNPAPRREAGKGVAQSLASRSTAGGGLGTDFDLDGGLVAKTPTQDESSVSRCLNAGGMGRQDYETETLIPTGGGFDVAHSLKADGFDASEDGTGRGVPLVAAPLKADSSDTSKGPPNLVISVGLGSDPLHAENVAQPVTNRNGDPGVIAIRTDVTPKFGDVGFTLTQPSPSGGGQPQAVMTVRRLTPRECERLQGFPDDYTLVEYRKKPAADGPRYKALGNSMAVPVMNWIGRRINDVTQSTRSVPKEKPPGGQS